MFFTPESLDILIQATLRAEHADAFNAATGRYSTSIDHPTTAANPGETHPFADIMFSNAANPEAINLLITSDNVAAILFYHDEELKILSSPKASFLPNGTAMITGQVGDEIAYTAPGAVPSNLLTRYVRVLTPRDDDNTAHLQHLQATYLITDLIPAPALAVDDPDNVLLAVAANAPVVLPPAANNNPIAPVAPDDEAPPPPLVAAPQIAAAAPPAGITFPHPVLDPYSTFDEEFAHLCITEVPIVIPLPPGHAIDPCNITNRDHLATLLDKIDAAFGADLRFRKTVQGWILSFDYFEAKSLQHAYLAIPHQFHTDLPTVHVLHPTIDIPITPVDPSLPAGQDVYRRIAASRTRNVQKWCSANPDLYRDLTQRHGTATAAAPAPPQQPDPTAATDNAQLPTPHSIKDKRAVVNQMRNKTIWQLLLGSVVTTEDGRQIYQPATLSEAFLDILTDSPKNSLRHLQSLIQSHITNKTNDEPLNSINANAKFPDAIINLAFSAATINAHFETKTLAEAYTASNNNLGLMCFAPVAAGTAASKRQMDETSAVIQEHLFEEEASNKTKVSLGLYKETLVRYYSHVLMTMANFMMFIDAMLDPTPGLNPNPALIASYTKTFVTISDQQVRDWVHHNTTPEVQHLPYALCDERHNTDRILYTIAADPTNIRNAIQKREIPADTIKPFEAFTTSAIAKLTNAVRADSLGPYASAPRAWVLQQQYHNNKEKKKSTRTTYDDSPQNRGRPPTTNAVSPSPYRPNYDTTRYPAPAGTTQGGPYTAMGRPWVHPPTQYDSPRGAYYPGTSARGPPPARTPPPGGYPDHTGSRRNDGAFGRLDRRPNPGGGSNPNLGMIDTPRHDTVLQGPLIPSVNTRACIPFLRYNSSCPHGSACPLAHVSYRSPIGDILAVDAFVNANAGVTWHNRRPLQLDNIATAAPTQPPPPNLTARTPRGASSR